MFDRALPIYIPKLTLYVKNEYFARIFLKKFKDIGWSDKK